MRFQQDIFCSNLFFSSDQSDFDWGSRKEKICSLLCFSFLTLEGAESATLLKLTMHVSEAPPIDKTEKFRNLSLQNEEVYGNFSKCYGKVVVVTSPSHLKNNIFDSSTYIEIRVELFTFFHSFHLTKKIQFLIKLLM